MGKSYGDVLWGFLKWISNELGWAGQAGLGWPGLAWAGLGWPGLAWAGLGWPELAWANDYWITFFNAYKTLTRFFFQKISKSSRDKGLLRTAILAVKSNSIICKKNCKMH